MRTKISHIILFFLEFFVIFLYIMLFVFYPKEFLNNGFLFLLASGSYIFLRWLGTEERLKQNKYFNCDMLVCENEKGEIIIVNSKGKRISIKHLSEALESYKQNEL